MRHRIHLQLPNAGFTIVELLVAAAIALTLMGFVATVFSSFGQAVGESQDVSRMHDEMRATAWVLRQDLAGVTCRVVPWQKPEADVGYFELLEGPYTDTTGPDPTDPSQTKDLVNTPTFLVADVDDVLMFTTQRRGVPFVSQLENSPIDSPYAEVVWFCTRAAAAEVEGQRLYELRRRQQLVRPYIGTDLATLNENRLDQAAQHISKRRQYPGDTNSVFLPNGLSDLTKRENRFLHDDLTFPFEVTLSELQTNGLLPDNEDVVLRNVIAFDIRVFDPQHNPPRFIDLGSNHAGTTLLERQMDEVTTGQRLATPTFCTWSMHYEFNGIDEDNAEGPDQGTNGLDDNDDGNPDDPDEFETRPPYRVPLLGIQATIRCIEPNSKQIRQITIRHSFPQ